ncbi:MAG TPA: hypothetical protein VME23_09590 [Terracidiphilus sp.]|nr:hypothetical protein [Terracidiphilus sp.]
MKTNLKSRERHTAELPANPERKARNLEDLGIRESVLEDIALKILYLHGPFSILDLSDLARISYDSAEQFFNRLRAKVLYEVIGMTGKSQIAGRMPATLRILLTNGLRSFDLL